MAKIQTNVSESVFYVKRWRGVNEAEEGEAALRNGEGAVCKNFRVTSGGALKKRNGSKNVAGLAAEYTVQIAEEDEILFTETGLSDMELELYPRVEASSMGFLSLEGEPVTVSGTAEAAAAQEKFIELDGKYYRFNGESYTAARKTGTKTTFADDGGYYFTFSEPPVFHDGEWDLTGAVAMSPGTLYLHGTGKYLIPPEHRAITMTVNSSDITKYDPDNTTGTYCKVTEVKEAAVSFWTYEVKTDLYSQPVYGWAFRKATAEPSSNSDREVKALWSGMVSGREVIVAACNGNLWELTLTAGEWSKATCGTIDTTGTVSIFGFDGKAYILTDTEYKVWNGTIMADVAGYRPLISVTNPPAGGGTLLEEVNKLTGARRAWYSPDGTAATFRLPETGLTSIDWVKSTVTGEAITNWKYDLEAGTVTFGAYSTGIHPVWTDEPPAAGTDTIEIAWTYPTSYRTQVIGMKYAEIFNGAQDTRLFLYGDGSNKAIYSGLDYDGLGRADYFPDLNEAAVGDENTPITAMIRHYDRLLCFKLDSTWSISYSTITLADGSTTAGYYVVPVNRDVGSCAYGEARLVENRPRTLDGRSVIEWKPSSGGYLTADQRNAERVSKRVDTSIRGFDLSSARTFYDKINHEYYVIGSNGTALVNNVDADAWYIYTGFDARCMIVYQDEVYYGDGDGYLRHFSADYYSDNGEAIDCLWESGAMDFSQDFRRKYSAMIWVGIKPEENGYIEASAETDRKTDFADYEVERDDAGAVPEMTRLKIKAKKFTYYKLIFKNETADTTATVVSADIRVRSTGYVR